MRYDMQARADAYKAAFPENPAAWPWVVQEDGRQVLYAVWVIGANYGNETGYYGAHPRGYLRRVMALFPDAVADGTLHAFSGSLPPGPYFRMDVRKEQKPEFLGSVYSAATLVGQKRFSLLTGDPPYADEDAERYGTPMVDRLRATEALADVAVPGAHLVWLDTCWPMHRKTHWRTVGRIFVQRSTNHRIRGASIFERTDDASAV